jgi:hypothetical protein
MGETGCGQIKLSVVGSIPALSVIWFVRQAMAKENKTKPTGVPVEDFIGALADERQRVESWELIRVMGEITGETPYMWGPSIVGFGHVHYRYASGREGDIGVIGFAPRKGTFVIYLVDGLEPYGELLARLGPHKGGKCCLYIKRLSDVDMDVLRQIMESSCRYARDHVDAMHKVC